MMLDMPVFGLATAFGAGEAPIAAARADRMRAFSTDGDFIGLDYRPQLRAFAGDAGLPGVEARVAALVSGALGDLGAQMQTAGASWPRCGLVLLTPAAGPGLDDGRAAALAEGVARMLHGAGWFDPACGMVSVRSGAAGSAEALLAASRMAAQAPVLLVAADSHACRQRLNALNTARALFSGAMRWGFIPGEAAFAALCLPPSAERRGGLRLHGCAQGTEPVPEHAGADSAFTGLSDAGHAAAAQAGRPAGMVLSDWNNSRYRASELSYALLRLSERLTLPPPEPVFPALEFGHAGAAWLATACASLAPGGGPALLLCGNDNDGTRAALVLERAGQAMPEPAGPPGAT